MASGTLSGIYIYPVKSCGSISLSQTHGDSTGLAGDRQWVFVGGGDNVLTQRDHVSMALIQPTLLNENGYKLQLDAPNMPPIKVEHSQREDGFCEIDLWDNVRCGYDQGDAVASWISEYLKTDARLLYTKVDLSKNVRYVDCSPLLIISEDSLHELNSQLEEPVLMSRFRPSLVIKNLGEYCEDKSDTLTVGTVTFSGLKQCGRCVMINMDQEKGVLKGSEPLKTLSKYRKVDGKVMFGRYFKSDSDFVLRLGMEVTV